LTRRENIRHWEYDTDMDMDMDRGLE
jgi:hypothetical protein